VPLKNKLAIIVLVFIVFDYTSNVLAQGIWVKDSSKGFIPREVYTASAVGGKIYVIGGSSSLTTLDIAPVQVFDPMTHTWSTPSASGNYTSNRDLASSVMHDSIYVFGGTPWVSIFDPATNNWSSPVTTGNFTQRSSLHSVIIDGKIYLVGWLFHSHVYDNSVEVFDPSIDEWSRADTVGLPYFRMEIFPNYVMGKIYIIRGPAVGGNPVITLDPKTAVWDTLVTSGSNLMGDIFSTCVLNNKIYVLGNTGSGNSSSNIMQIFDPATNSWTTPVVKGMFTAGSGLTATVVNGNIYALAGDSVAEGGIAHLSNIVEVYIPSGLEVPSKTEPKNLVLSPNPTTGIITVHNTPPKILHVTITNVLGKIVNEMQNPSTSDFTIDLSKLPPGTYFARFSSAGEVITKKIIKE
jgi:hypothetical protein